MKIRYEGFFVIILSLLIVVGDENARKKRQTEEAPVIFPDFEEIPEKQCVVPDGSDGSCRPAGLCVFRFDSISQSELSACTMENDEIGVCCPKKPPPSRGTGPARPLAEDPISLPDISSNDLDSAGQEGLSTVQQVDQLETELRRKGLFTKKGTAAHFHQSFFGDNREELSKLGRHGLIGVEATLRLVKTFQLDTVQSRDGLSRFSLTNTVIRDTCPKPPPCPPTKYRTVDGSCNNLNNPTWGKSFTAFARLLPPRYSDGINSPRMSYDGGPLPSAREVSYRNIPDAKVLSKGFTSSLMQWGQFIDHDISKAAKTSSGKGEGIACCDEEIQRNPRLLHPACLPIFIPSNDPFYARFEQTCMEFVRSIAAPRPECTFGPREQLNQLTTFIDASTIYGSSENETILLRSFEGGKLKSTLHRGKELLYVNPKGKNEDCMATDARQKCFMSGDNRVNEHNLLTVMHTIWLREHNRIATALSRLNKGWNDEILFRESRRLVGAEVQHITYTEFLPLLLGSKVTSSFKLVPKLAGYSFDYDRNLNPSIINGFAAAAYRLTHSLVPDSFDLVNRKGDKIESVLLSAQYFNPSRLYRNSTIDNMARGMIKQPTFDLDKYVTSQLTNHFFEIPGNGYGLDLVAINIQRGRDHGLPGYNEWRQHCGLPRVRNFEDLATAMDPTSAGNFSRIYRNVDDIDLFAAGLSENALPDALVGATFACIVAEQFRRLKHGDRFWYENGGMESSFTETQLAEVRKVTLARILCDNTDISDVQLVAFIKPTSWNPTVACRGDKIPEMNLSSWRNEPVWT